MSLSALKAAIRMVPGRTDPASPWLAPVRCEGAPSWSRLTGLVVRGKSVTGTPSPSFFEEAIMPLKCLRSLTDAALALDQAYEKLSGWAHAPQRCTAISGVRYLRFRCGEGATAWEGQIAVTDWLGHALPALAGIGVTSLSDSALLDLARRLPMPEVCGIAPLPSAPWQVLEIRNAGDVEPPAVQVGLVLLERLPAEGLPDVRESLPGELPVRLEFRLGSSTIAAPRLARVGEGDVLMILEAGNVVLADGHPLFAFTYSEKEIVMEHPQTPLAGSPVSLADASPLASVPVRVDVLLHSETRTLAQLEALVPGSCLALPEGAEMRVVLQANGCVLGHGELVEIQGRLGVQITALARGV